MHADRLTEYRNGDLVFDVIDTGPLDGTPIVLLHGFPQRASSWEAVSAHLHERGARTFAPDQRGYSPRARPRSRFAYRAPELVSDVHALVTAIGGGPVDLVGHDWGAAGAWGVAAQHADLIRTLTIVSVPHPRAFLASFVRSAQLLRSYYMALFQIPALPEWILSNGPGEWLLRKYGMTPEMIKTYRTEIVDYGALHDALAWYRALPVTRPTAMPARVSVPTTLVWSDGDTAITRKAAELTRRYVSGDYAFEEMAGVSHWIPDERPAELAAIIARRAGLDGS